ncbi:glycoside hydrolase family 3 C-terminal domain-containing protein [Maribacter sp. PR1]|uniref:Glycoside hydrolase family 3 N-terminal domain-containing protein n=1 Tax=Maribacter cobaltidurans TaxID=1178778 RepID=A0ABU7IV50_9FLAO|nr:MULTISPECIES: glycoside hydrolase family 3 N-terminal domain-containing protein [Maribacter]MDC6389101.1 glycoside hydrolase family 3 C-terminal domain-containing protein [Maribacter sp. PR1]MEE1976488.1 glycoside hydrolase family 3 N-terminal domain-containing protein [Maribacter cobaltidurans]
MRKILRITLKTFGVILVILIVSGLLGWWYVSSQFLNFEDDYTEKEEIPKLTIDGYTFLDRNENGVLDVYEDDRVSIADRVEDLLSQMTLEEKIHILKGSGMASGIGMVDPEEGIPGVVGTIVATPRLGMPALNLSDGPAGLRIEPTREGIDRTFYCTAFPIATLLASTWNTDLAYKVGDAMGNEALEYGIDVILGPGANIHRHPFCGRNFEYYSEDPLVTGKIGAAMVNGIESNGIGTSVKHFVANNQETNRNFNDTRVSDRAMREIYLKGFEIIVEDAQPWTIMSSYNKVNGTHTAESKHLLTDVLRDDWGFEGLVMSDWFGGSDAVAMVNAGNDLLEPGTKKQWDALTKGHDEGTLNMDAVDTSVKRILTLIFKSQKMKGYKYSENPDLKAHAEITRKSASEGIVLLKNEATLPLEKGKNVALIGVYSYDFIAGGTGSGDVNEAYTVSLEEGLANTGFSINQKAKDAYHEHKTANPEAFVKPEGMSAMFNPYLPTEMTYNAAMMQDIVAESDLAIITIGRNSGEGGDRVATDDFLLSDKEKDILQVTCKAFHAANKKVIVVLNIGGVLETASWKDQPDAIVLAWQGGQEGGNAVADILSGQVNPSGKLTVTFPVEVEDHASNVNFPQNGLPMKMTDLLFGKDDIPEDKMEENVDFTEYEEGVYVGYRHFDKANLDVSYPFGYGMSYTNFEYGEMELVHENDSLKITVPVMNTGQVSGKEVVQFYISKDSTQIDRPVQELKAFAKTVLLSSGETDTLRVHVPVKNLRYWNESSLQWTLESGTYKIKAGASSRAIKKAVQVKI